MDACLSTAEMLSRVDFDREAMARYVLSRRTPQGGYCYYRVPTWGVEEPNAPDTLAALESLRLLGTDPPRPELTRRYLQSLQRADGGYPTLTIGWASVRALGLLGAHPSLSPSGWAAKWAATLTAPAPDAELAGLLRDTARLADVAAATASELDADQRRWAKGLLETASDPAGGWARPSPDLATTGLAVAVATATGSVLPALPAQREFLRRCEDPVLGLRLRPRSATTSAGALWGGLMLADVLATRLCFPGALATNLMLLQRPDGGLGSRHRAISTLVDTWQGLGAASMFDKLAKEGLT